MYKHQPSNQRSVRDSWQVLESIQTRENPRVRDAGTSRRSSVPITIFSACESSEDNVVNRGILPAHVGGVFTNRGYDAISAHAANTAIHDTQSSQLVSESEVLTSLGSALGEVLDSVDETTQIHQQARSNARIQDWLGEQSDLHKEKKRKCSQEEQQRMKKLTERIMRDLLGVDSNVLDILFRSNTAVTPASTERAAAQIELGVWKRWIELAKRDTASLSSFANRSGSTSAACPPATHASRRPSLERIPWGVPEDPQDDEYWNEKISLPMIYRYLKSCLTKQDEIESQQTSDSADNISQRLSPPPVVVSSQTEASETVMAESTGKAMSTIGPVSPARLPLAGLSRNFRRAQHDRSRSRTSRSSSFRTASHAGSCSVQSMRRSVLGSHFWDLGSLGGVSISSREVGNWSIYG